MKRPDDRYARYCAAIRGEALPLALVDLDAVDANLAVLLAPVRERRKTLRLATKSIRCVDLIRYIVERGGAAMRGLMAYAPDEARYLVEQGFDDVLIAYPTAHPVDARIIAEANRGEASVSIAVEENEHLEVLDAAAKAAGVIIPVIVDVDVSLRRAFGKLHIGVRRSPLHSASAVADFVDTIARFRHLTFDGLLGYEAHIAGLSDQGSLGALGGGAKRAMKRVAREEVMELRREILVELSRRGARVSLFNGGGTGSVAFSAADPSLTEVTAGSGFLDSHLFDHYDGLHLEPAVFFALQVTRRPAPGFITCQGGGYIASGAAGSDRLPIPYLPEGLTLLGMEGAGEVQTPLRVPDGARVGLGDPVFFRHAKAGELATFFREYALVRGDRIEARVKTYRGAGECFH